MRKKKILSILISFTVFLIIFDGNLDSNYIINTNNKKSLENMVHNDDVKISSSSFSGEGNTQNVSLYSNRETTFLNNNTVDEGITIENSIAGWNMTNFELNFTDLYTTDKYVAFEIRNDNSITFDNSNIYYAMSFEIPNTCILKNISIFLQYNGGDNGFTTTDSSFNITIYNATIISNKLEPDKPINQSPDETLFNLTVKPANQPAKWYQANFTNRILNISETKNNTFFAVFQSIDFPGFAGLSNDAFFYYAEEQPSNQYEIFFYEGAGASPTWTLQDGKNGLFRVNLAPIDSTPTPDQINLTVFNTLIDSSGLYTNNTFFPHQDNDFLIPISSPWFADVKYNISFQGQFRYDTISQSNFNITVGEDVFWNSTIIINQFSSDSYNKTARFNKPTFWIYNNTYNGTALYSDTNIQVNPKYIDLLNISNHNWTICYNQTNAIINKTIQASSDQINWNNIQDFANITDFINVTAQFNNSNGYASMYVKTTNYDIILQENLIGNTHNFPLWRPDQNTTAIENNTLIEIEIRTFNGTMAGIETFSFNTILSQMNVTLLDDSSEVLKNTDAYYHFSLKNLYNDESLSIEDLIIKTKRESGTWQTLSRYHHYDIEILGSGEINITIDTSHSDFVPGDYLINFTMLTTYFTSNTYNSTLKINYRSHNITINGASQSNRVFQLGDYATYYIYLNDSLNGNDLVGAEFTIRANFSGTSQIVNPVVYNVIDHNNGSYDITFITDILYDGKPLDNLTIEFYSEKSGIYSQTNQNDTLKIYNIPRTTNLTILSNSSNIAVIGDTPWLCLRFFDKENNDNLTNAQFKIYNNTKLIPSYSYLISELSDKYNITFLLDYLDMGYYNLTIIANKSREGEINYEDSYIAYNLTYNPANFIVDLEIIPVLYTNDTTKTIILNLTYTDGYIDDASITSYLGSNQLDYAPLGSGLYKIFLDSTNLTIGSFYQYNITISKIGFNTYINDTINVEIFPFPLEITVPEDYQDLILYQDQNLEIFAILKDTFQEKDILNANIRMKIDGFVPYSDYFEGLAINFGWYRGNLEIGGLTPGVYNVTIEMTAANYIPSQTSINITVLERKESVFEILTDFNDYYVWGDTITIEVKLIAGGTELLGKTIKFEITETLSDGKVNIETFYDTTDSNGIAKIDYKIKELDAFKIDISFEGEDSLRASEYTESNIDVRSTSEQFIIVFTPFIPVIIGVIMGLTGYVLVNQSKKKKKRKVWQKKNNIFNDILNIDYVLIIHKLSGSGLVNKNVSGIETDGDLISGFLHAITTFKHEIKREVGSDEDKSGFLLDYQDYKILLQEGEYIKVAMILNSEPSESLKNQLLRFIEQFETKYYNYLEDFQGDITPFKDYMELINEIFKLSLIRPQIVNKHPPNIKITSFQENILSVATALEIDDQMFYMSKLLNYLISAMPKVPKEKIIANIYDLFEFGFITPAEI